jgi:hypothetical protein
MYKNFIVTDEIIKLIPKEDINEFYSDVNTTLTCGCHKTDQDCHKYFAIPITRFIVGNSEAVKEIYKTIYNCKSRLKTYDEIFGKLGKEEFFYDKIKFGYDSGARFVLLLASQQGVKKIPVFKLFN